jgi:hypothetical protein
MKRSRCALAALSLLLAADAHSGKTATGYGAALMGGYDSNPVLVTDDGPGGSFTQTHLGGWLRRDFGRDVALFVSGDIGGRLHDGGAANADYLAGDARAGVTWSPIPDGRLALTAGGFHSRYRSTFVDRLTGETYEVVASPPTDPPTNVAVPDRLDHDANGAFLEARWRHNRRLGLFVEAALDRVGYAESYTELTGLDGLDYRSLVLEPGLALQVSEAITLGMSVAFTDLDYEDRPALDATGNEVAATQREYRFAQYRLALRVLPAERWSLNFGAAHIGRDDTHAGYYDSATRSLHAAADRTIGDRGRVSVYGQLLRADYDAATVTGDSLDLLRGNDLRRLIARFEQGAGRHFEWFFEGGTEDADSRDPIYAYERDWFLSGVRFRR